MQAEVVEDLPGVGQHLLTSQDVEERASSGRPFGMVVSTMLSSMTQPSTWMAPMGCWMVSWGVPSGMSHW